MANEGTGEELYMTVFREFSSVGVPSWEDRVAQADANPQRASIFSFGLDEGPDNQLFSRFVRAHVNECPVVASVSVWCCIHQCHLCVGSHLALMDSFQWLNVEHPAKIHGALASISNVWRSPGTPRKLEKTVAETFGEEAVDLVAKKLGRAIKGRRGRLKKSPTRFAKTPNICL